MVNGSWVYSSEIKKGANSTSHVISISEGAYYPFGPSLTNVSFRVKGIKKDTKKTNYKMSSWSAWYGQDIKPPASPIITYERSSHYRTTFTINHSRHINDREY